MMMGNYKQINHQMVTLARESRGLTQPELARILGVNQGWISRVEGGLRTIKPAVIDELAKSLNYPIDFFTFKDKIYGLGINSYFHRKKQSISNRTLRKVHALIYIRTMHIARLLRGVETVENKIRPINIEDFDNDASEIARIVRLKWQIPHGPIDNVTSIIEDAGGIIIPFDFETNDIDAVYHYTPETSPLFFTNRTSPSDRLRLTTCHELGHAIIHSETFDPELVEKQAYEFAAEFLMPKNEIFAQLSDLSLEKLMILKQYWKVSMSALLKRAGDIGAITPTRSKQLWMQMSKAGLRRHEPPELNIPYEEPSTLKQLVRVYFEDMDYRIPEFAKLISLNQDETHQYYIEPELYHKFKESRDAIKDVERMLRDNQA